MVKTTKTVTFLLYGVVAFLLILLVSIKINRVLDTKYLTPTEYAEKYK